MTVQETSAPFTISGLPPEAVLKRNIAFRQIIARVWRFFFLLSIIIGLVALLLLFYNIVRQAFTLVAIENTIEPETLTGGRSLEELSEAELIALLKENSNKNRLRVLILNTVLAVPQQEWSLLNEKPLNKLLEADQYPQGMGDLIFKDLDLDQAAAVLEASLSRDGMERAVIEEVIQPVVVDSWTLNDYLLKRDEIEQEVKEKHPNAELQFRSWVSLDFLTTPMSSRPELSGLRTAILGSVWMMIITILFAFPIGIGAAIYLEEYATDNWINRIIRTNISNLAGVPSIIYGILGLAVFVRAMEPITSGDAFGLLDSGATRSGRTILAAGMTMALLILPIVIINAQEAIRAVPPSLREASLGLGATKWRTIRSTVLPSAMPGILTGTILAISRAFGETAPLVVVGSITRITVDPSGPFSRFTAIPIQIYTWTAQPQDEFRSIAAAAIIVLLAILLLFNSAAIILRNRFSNRG